MNWFAFLFFYLLILFLPTQLGRHFFFDFSLVSGIRVDYLAPTLYVTDILIFLLFIVWILGVCHRESRRVGTWRSQSKRDCFVATLLAMTSNLNHLKFVALVVFVMFLIFGILLSKNQAAGWYGFLKLLEFIFLGFYTAGNIKRLNFGIILLLLSIGIIFESFLAILQYFNQGSMGGIFYFFGERGFNGQTPGIANASVGGEFILRPYGTFSHPNVLAGYLTIALAMVRSNVKCQMSNVKKIILATSLIAGTIALFLTMSRVAILVWIFIVLMFGFIKIRKHIKTKLTAYYLLLTTFVAGSIFLFSPLHSRFADIKLTDESIVVRQELIKSSFLMIKDNPLFGVGLNNFLVELPNYQKIKNYFIDLQPAHNVFLLVAAQTGIVGLIFFLWFIFKTYRQLKSQILNLKATSQNLKLKKKDNLIINPSSLIIILCLIFILGFFDHYFLTLQQGQLLFSFILGLCWSKSSKRSQLQA